MAKKLKIGIIGMSDGNGHPYSWSAIFNGYNQKYMKDCPFPVIPEYLSLQKFPDDGLSHLGAITHIWTQKNEISKHIANSANIEHVVDNMSDMINKVDAIILARDDAENHYDMAFPFLLAGLPVFIDKPLALSVEDAKRCFAAQIYENQIFTCSSLRYAEEMMLTEEDKNLIGEIRFVEGSVMKKWETYAIHIIEPLVAQLPDRGKLIRIKNIYVNNVRQVLIQWENVSAYLKVTGQIPVPLEISFFGEQASVTKFDTDTYASFKATLERFVHIINGVKTNIDKEETIELIEIIEKGLS
jgi:hypothetical protein